jgi:hypothetical protein
MGHVDVLINNAGVPGVRMVSERYSPGALDASKMAVVSYPKPIGLHQRYRSEFTWAGPPFTTILAAFYGSANGLCHQRRFQSRDR